MVLLYLLIFLNNVESCFPALELCRKLTSLWEVCFSHCHMFLRFMHVLSSTSLLSLLYNLPLHDDTTFSLVLDLGL